MYTQYTNGCTLFRFFALLTLLKAVFLLMIPRYARNDRGAGGRTPFVMLSAAKHLPFVTLSSPCHPERSEGSYILEFYLQLC